MLGRCRADTTGTPSVTGSPLGRPHLSPLLVGGAARSAHAGPHRHYRPVGFGAGQQPVGVVTEVGQEGLEVGLAERPHRAAGPVLVVEGPGVGAGHRGAPYLCRDRVATVRIGLWAWTLLVGCHQALGRRRRHWVERPEPKASTNDLDADMDFPLEAGHLP
jgi:hypothetical protein